MATIRSFQGLRYNPKRVKIGLVTAPPYDVISPKEQQAFYDLDERNVVRLILGQEFPLDDSSHNRYTRSREFLESWQKEKVLIQEKEPAIYVYQQEFAHPETKKKIKRLSFLCALKVEEFGKGKVYPHEATLKGPKADRLKLISTTRANLSAVYGLYNDNKNAVRKNLLPVTKKKALFAFKDKQNVSHKVWPVTDKNKIQKITKLFKTKDIFIADGHHRYETAFNYSRSLKKGSVSPNEKDNAGHILIAMSAFEDPGLAMFPTHRLLMNSPKFDLDKVIKKLSQVFEIEAYDINKLEKRLNKVSKKEQCLGIYSEGEAYLIKISNTQLFKKKAPKGKSKEWQKLSASVASELVIKPIFKINEKNKEKHLVYTHFFQESVDLVDSGDAQCAVILPPTSIEEMKKICKLKQRMPQKSTYFYPKLASGVVFHKHEA